MVTRLDATRRSRATHEKGERDATRRVRRENEKGSGTIPDARWSRRSRWSPCGIGPSLGTGKLTTKRCRRTSGPRVSSLAAWARSRIPWRVAGLPNQRQISTTAEEHAHRSHGIDRCQRILRASAGCAETTTIAPTPWRYRCCPNGNPSAQVPLSQVPPNADSSCRRLHYRLSARIPASRG